MDVIVIPDLSALDAPSPWAGFWAYAIAGIAALLAVGLSATAAGWWLRRQKAALADLEHLAAAGQRRARRPFRLAQHVLARQEAEETAWLLERRRGQARTVVPALVAAIVVAGVLTGLSVYTVAAPKVRDNVRTPVAADTESLTLALHEQTCTAGEQAASVANESPRTAESTTGSYTVTFAAADALSRVPADGERVAVMCEDGTGWYRWDILRNEGDALVREQALTNPSD